MFLVYESEEDPIVNGYTNASFRTNRDDSQLQFEFVFYLNEGAISQKNTKKETIPDFTINTKYITTLEATNAHFCIRNYVFELGVIASVPVSFRTQYNKNGVFAQAKEPRSYKKS